MSNLRTHFATGSPAFAACGRGRRLTDNVSRVDCQVCRSKPHFQASLADFMAKLESDFQAQTPRTVVPQFGRVNDDGVMECFKCHGVLFRERPRSLFSYHYVCDNCGTSLHPMTETGMCS